MGDKKKTGLIGVFSAAPSFAVAGLAPFSCPACLPALVGLLSSFGIGIAAITPFVFPLTSLLIALALVPLFLNGSKTRNFKPAILGGVGGIMMFVGMLFIPVELVVYGGAALLVYASFLNMSLRKEETDDACPACATTKQSA